MLGRLRFCRVFQRASYHSLSSVIEPISAAELELAHISEFKQSQKLRDEGRFEPAISTLTRSLDFLQYAPPPFLVAARLKLATLHQEMGDSVAEIKERRLILQDSRKLSHPQLTEFAHASLALALIRAQQYQDVLPLTQTAAQSGVASLGVTAHLFAGLSHLVQKHTDAEKYLSEAANLARSSALLRLQSEAMLGLASFYADIQSNLAQAQTTLQDAIQAIKETSGSAQDSQKFIDELHSIALTRLGEVQIRLNQFDAAHASLAQALKLAETAGVQDVWLVDYLAPLAVLSKELGKAIESEGLFRSCISKLRYAKPFTATHQLSLLRVTQQYAALLARLEFNSKSRKAEGDTLLQQEMEKAKNKFPRLRLYSDSDIILDNWIVERYK